MNMKFKKLAACLVATASLTTGIIGMSASASEIALNGSSFYSVTTSTVTDVVVGDDGTTIPLGSTAVTVSLNGNTGFDSSTTKLNIGTANVIVDNEGNPVYNVGTVLESSLVASATNDNLVAFSTASADEVRCDGDMFTFYISSGFDGIEIVDEEMEKSKPLGNIVSPMATLRSYIIGDVDQDSMVTASDASTILHALSLYEDEFNDDVLPVSYANSHLNVYFPHALVAESADGNKSGSITEKDASLVLTYYSHLSTGNTEPVAYLGELVYIIM